MSSPQRLVDRPPDHATSEGRAIELLRNLPAAPALSPAQVARVEDRLTRVSLPARRWGHAALAAGVAAAVAVACGLAWRTAPAGRPVTLREPRTVRLVDDGRLRIALEGPGSAEVPAPFRGALTLGAGRLLVRAGERPVIVDAPGAHVTVRPGATVTVEIRTAEVQIAAYAGTASVAWGGSDRTIEVAAGTALSRRGVAPLSRESSEIERALGVEAAATAPRAAVDSSPPLPVVPPALSPSAARAPRRVAAPQTVGVAVAAPVVADPVAELEPDDPKLADPSDRSPEVAERAPAEAPAVRELELFDDAIRRLRRQGDPAGALAALDLYQTAFPHGRLEPEAERARVEALLAVRRSADALALLDRMDLASHAGGLELQVVRGELRARAGRCAGAIRDFEAALAAASGSLEERSLYGRASCRTHLGDAARARPDLERYLARFPHGTFAAAVRKALGSE